MSCKCGNYKPYSSTMIKGVAYSPAMPLNKCVNCFKIEFDEELFSSAMKKVHKNRSSK